MERSNKKFTVSYFFYNSWLKIENKKAKKKKLSSTASADVLVLRKIIERKQQGVQFVSFSLDFIPDPSLYSKITSQVIFILRPIFENQTKFTSNPIAFILRLIQFCLLYSGIRFEEFRILIVTKTSLVTQRVLINMLSKYICMFLSGQ